jgi:glycosyltransferase involved in cell wall biosynthesis
MSAWELKMESLQRRASLLHGWGTLSGPLPEPEDARLVARADSGATLASLPVIFGRRTSAASDHQVEIDFVIYGPWNLSPEEGNTYHLILEWRDGKQSVLETKSPRAVATTGMLSRVRSTPWIHFCKRGLSLVRQGRLSVLADNARRVATTLFSTTRRLKPTLDWALAGGKSLILVIDHNLGGGANQYRKNLMAESDAQKQAYALLTVHHGLLSYQLTISRDGVTRHAYVDDLDTFFVHLGRQSVSRVIFNNVVSFPAPLVLAETLGNWLMRHPSVDLLFLMHDHFCICPSWLLLNDSGQYCGIPAKAVCDRCLPKNPARFIEFSKGISIVDWRTCWSRLLLRAGEIRCFSNATKELLLRAYPDTGLTSITVVPHKLDHVQLRRVRLQDKGFPVIGIVGEISTHKGAHVVIELAQFIARSNIKFELVIIGTIDSSVPAGVTVTGPYLPSRLPDILEEHGINVIFFPSIWPETFSYVTEELMEMNMPLLAFDLGAPGERVKQYPLGKVISLGDSKALLDTIYQLYQEHVVNV